MADWLITSNAQVNPCDQHKHAETLGFNHLLSHTQFASIGLHQIMALIDDIKITMRAQDKGNHAISLRCQWRWRSDETGAVPIGCYITHHRALQLMGVWENKYLITHL